MGYAAKRGILSRLFGGSSSGCCSVKIEEVNEASLQGDPKDAGAVKAADAPSKTTESKPRTRRSACCG